jgi:hypothetical protein
MILLQRNSWRHHKSIVSFEVATSLQTRLKYAVSKEPIGQPTSFKISQRLGGPKLEVGVKQVAVYGAGTRSSWLTAASSR